MNQAAKSAKFAAFLAAIILLVGCAAPTTVRTSVSDVLREEEQKKQQRLAFDLYKDRLHKVRDIALPLFAASLPFCEKNDKVRRKGNFWAGNINTIPENHRDAASREYGIDGIIRVDYIAKNGVADKAGLRQGDVLVGVSGKNFPVGDLKGYDKILTEAYEDGAAEFSILRDERQVKIKLQPEPACDYGVVYLDGDHAVNAYADGDSIYVTKGMMRFADDYELAVVIAHEIAHNVMEHSKAKEQNFAGGMLLDLVAIGVTGVDTKIRDAAALAYSQEFEAEADYVGLYIMARAGLPLDKAPDLWRKMAAELGNIEKKEGIYATHPSTPERYVGLENTIREIKLKIEKGEELVPNLKEDSE